MVHTLDEYIYEWCDEIAAIAEALSRERVRKLVELLDQVRQRGGRLFVLGVGGSAANAAHATNDFRRIAGIEAYCPTSEVAELTALANDIGWSSIFVEWLKESRLMSSDAILVLSVNGGTSQISPHLVSAVNYAHERQASVLAIVGRKSGFAARHADTWVEIPCVNEDRRTPHSESFQLVVTHLLCWVMRDLMTASVSASPDGVPIV